MSAAFVPSSFPDLDGNVLELQLPNTGNWTWDPTGKQQILKGQAAGSGGDRWNLRAGSVDLVKVDLNGTLTWNYGTGGVNGNLFAKITPNDPQTLVTWNHCVTQGGNGGGSGGPDDVVFSMGWNDNGNGAALVAGQPVLCDGWESNFTDGGGGFQFERHVGLVTLPNATSVRPLTMTINKGSMTTNIQLDTGRLLIADEHLDYIYTNFNSVKTLKSITAISAANPTQITVAGHGLSTGDQVYVVNSNSTPTINGVSTVTVTGANTFTVPLAVSVAGTTGQIYYHPVNTWEFLWGPNVAQAWALAAGPTGTTLNLGYGAGTPGTSSVVNIAGLTSTLTFGSGGNAQGIGFRTDGTNNSLWLRDFTANGGTGQDIIQLGNGTDPILGAGQAIWRAFSGSNVASFNTSGHYSLSDGTHTLFLDATGFGSFTSNAINLLTDNTIVATFGVDGSLLMTGPITASAFSTAGTITLNSGAPTMILGAAPATSDLGIWNGQASPSQSNYVLLSSSSATFLNVPSGGAVELRINNATGLHLDASGVGVNTDFTGSFPGAAQLGVQIGSASRVGMVLNAAASQTADLLQVFNGSSALCTQINSNGRLYLATGSGASTFQDIVINGLWNSGEKHGIDWVYGGSSSNHFGRIELAFDGTQATLNVLNLFGGSGTALSIAGTTGNATFSGSVLPSVTDSVNLGESGHRWSSVYAYALDLNSGSAQSSGINVAPLVGASLIIGNSGTPSWSPLYIQAAASQTANLTVWQNSLSQTLAFISPFGSLEANQLFTAGGMASLGNSATSGVITSGPTWKGLVIQGSPSQSADLLQFHDSSGGIMASIDAVGNFRATNSSVLSRYFQDLNVSKGYWDTETTGINWLNVNRVTTNINVVIQAIASQSADLFQVQNNTSGVLAKITATGVVSSAAGFAPPTLSDSEATDGTIYLSSDHLDTNSAPKLCRKDASGNANVIG